MRHLNLAAIFTLLTAVTAFGADRHESYFTYDEGETVVRQADDGREVSATVNLPLFPGDEVVTPRAGRSEIRLADGNVIAVNRNTTIAFHSIYGSYDANDDQTVAELIRGEVLVHRLRSGSEPMRLDTTNASYVAARDAIFAVEIGHRGSDIVSVFDGTLSVRTREGNTTMRRGESANVDREGIYSTVSVSAHGTSEFHRWYMRRAERWHGRDSRYLDDRLAYADSDLNGNGSWLYMNDYSSWVWRPRVSSGWRPYHNGRWHHSPYGSLVWVSYESWGWVPYHYGRWALSPAYGWVWLPGSAYSPAWVYWAWGPSYVGWIPAGYYDCYRPYYDWAYRPYSRASVGFGFFGRVRLSNIDLRGWTFVTPDRLVSRNVDEAALATDVVRARLRRDGDRATVSNAGLRFRRNELKDPAAAVRDAARRQPGSGTGNDGSGSTADLTSFFRRDPDLSPAVRQSIATSRRPSVPSVERTPGGGSDLGSSLRRGGTTPGSTAPRTDRSARPSVSQPTEERAARRPAVPSRSSGRGSSGTELRREQPPAAAPSRRTAPPARSDNWRSGRDAAGAPAERSGGGERQPVPRSDADGVRSDLSPSRDRTSVTRGRSSDVPRRVIDQIGGARVTPSERRSAPARSSGRERPAVRSERSSSPSPSRSEAPRAQRRQESSSSRSSGDTPRSNIRSKSDD